MKKISILLLAIICFGFTPLKTDYPKSYFRSPTEGRMLLSGTFGELRSNHFHSGIDIKTGGVSGKNIYAIADGYISRINVSPTGFGKAIYIIHPNGYTSVYAHLSKFSQQVHDFVRQEQYKREVFSLNLYPDKDQFVIKKGQIIALSGNSGGSDGPHLHFEIRDSKTEMPINPLLFGFDVTDFIRPKITGFKLYPMNRSSKINQLNEELALKVSGGGLLHYVKNHDTINVSGDIGFGIQTHDLLNATNNRNGIYTLKLMLDSVLIYKHHLETFSFSETRYINSLIDYAQYIETKQRYQRSILDTGNKLSIYDSVYNAGIVNFSDSLYHNATYEVKDAHGNIAVLSCVLKSSPSKSLSSKDDTSRVQNWFEYDKQNSFENEAVKIEFRTGTFYNSFDFDYSTTDSPIESYAKLHKIQNARIPIHKSFILKIKPKNLAVSLQDKALIVEVDKDGINAVGGNYKDGFIVSRPSNLGNFTVVVDTIKPTIKALNIHNKKNISAYTFIIFEVFDKLSGISSYRATLNDKWILMEYDPKNNRLVYEINKITKKGWNNFELEVKDAKNNIAEFKAQIEF
ncbi:MAG: M23 family metallopeptidase [Bacteroidetes bacterium]|nr:M23 family metallopeptidase [Bacteroidota bacterium]